MNKYQLFLMNENESKDLYAIQKNVLDSKTEDNLKVLQLALVQCKAPIENYEHAVELLKLKAGDFEDIRIGIIGFYLSVLWLDNVDIIFRENVKMLYEKSSGYYQSLVEYLFALESYYDNDYNSALEHLNKSTELCDKNVCNYMLMSKLCSTKEKKILLNLARDNICKSIQCETEESIPCPNNYIEEFISGRMMPLETFESLILS